MHVLGRARGNDPQNLISWGIRIIDDFSMPMIANKFPSGSIIEGRIAQLLHRTAVGVFDHADIIDQHFAVGKQSHIELAPLIVRPTTTRCPLSIEVEPVELSNPTPPVVTALKPSLNSIEVAISSNLVAKFDEVIVAGNGNITIKNLTDS
ncbi:Ig-like domain-containing protein, partial [bacterium]|nr:Ig-like domain-containing protein [bacterium]